MSNYRIAGVYDSAWSDPAITLLLFQDLHFYLG